MTAPDDRLAYRITLDREGAAKALGVSVSTIDEWTRAAFLPSIHRGGIRLYSVRALERWADEQSAYEEARRGKAASVGQRVGLQAGWGQPLGRVRAPRRETPRQLRVHGEGGASDAG